MYKRAKSAYFDRIFRLRSRHLRQVDRRAMAGTSQRRFPAGGCRKMRRKGFDGTMGVSLYSPSLGEGSTTRQRIEWGKEALQ